MIDKIQPSIYELLDRDISERLAPVRELVKYRNVKVLMPASEARTFSVDQVGEDGLVTVVLYQGQSPQKNEYVDRIKSQQETVSIEVAISLPNLLESRDGYKKEGAYRLVSWCDSLLVGYRPQQAKRPIYKKSWQMPPPSKGLWMITVNYSVDIDLHRSHELVAGAIDSIDKIDRIQVLCNDRIIGDVPNEV